MTAMQQYRYRLRYQGADKNIIISIVQHWLTVQNTQFKLVKVDHITAKNRQIVLAKYDDTGTAFDVHGVPVSLDQRWHQRLLNATADLQDYILRMKQVKTIRNWPWYLVPTGTM